LVEFPRDEDAPGQHDDLLQLIHDRGLSDTRVASDEYELAATMFRDAVEGAILDAPRGSKMRRDLP